MSPEVSVILPVYNGADHLREAIDSILGQTFDNFEFIIVDDGSTDETPSILRSYNDPRIRVVTQENRGISATLNRLLELAQADLIARQDHDDISLPDRLARQVALFKENPKLGLVGSWAEIFTDTEAEERYHRHPVTDLEIRLALLFGNPFVHSAVMFRKAVIECVGEYTTEPSRLLTEDFELWSRMIRVSEAANVPEVLLRYREVESSLSRVGTTHFLETQKLLSSENIVYWSQGRITQDEGRTLFSSIYGDLTPVNAAISPFRFVTLFAILCRAVASAPSERSVAFEFFRARVDQALPIYFDAHGLDAAARPAFSALLKAFFSLQGCFLPRLPDARVPVDQGSVARV